VKRESDELAAKAEAEVVRRTLFCAGCCSCSEVLHGGRRATFEVELGGRWCEHVAQLICSWATGRSVTMERRKEQW
jgi:hypothetical protein